MKTLILLVFEVSPFTTPELKSVINFKEVMTMDDIKPMRVLVTCEESQEV